jgi:L-iditol 2-dehydrogenase
MKALVLKEYNQFSFEDLPEPDVKNGDVLIKIKSCAICGSDIHGMDGSTGRRIPPIVMGHEASGVVVETGSDSNDYKPGDRVTFDSTIYCGHCFFCRRGEINLCENRKVIGVSCADYHLNGAFAEYITVPARVLYHLPDGISFDQAAMVEPLSIALHAVSRTHIAINSTAAVVGAGMIGLMIVQLLKLAGCGQIAAIDLDQGKLDLARQFGATMTLKAGDADAGECIRQITGGRGTDLAFEAVGLTPTVQTAISVLRKGGSLVLVGNLASSVEIPLQSIVTRQISLSGSCASSGEYAAGLDLVASGKVDVDTFISAVAPLSDGAAWFRRLYANEPGLMKVILAP